VEEYGGTPNHEAFLNGSPGKRLARQTWTVNCRHGEINLDVSEVILVLQPLMHLHEKLSTNPQTDDRAQTLRVLYSEPLV